MNAGLIVFEDEDILVANKPAGWNTHSPSPFAGEGLYEWLKKREPRWSELSILHRLDKETSGLIVFGKTTEANRSLSRQFESRAVRKKYIFLTDREPPKSLSRVKTALVRSGERYLSRPVHAGAEIAETIFSSPKEAGEVWQVEAEPVTGKTHQIRVHAAAGGYPVLGDKLYGGSPFARLCLHAAEVRFKHPVTGKELCFTSAADFSVDPRAALRDAIIDPAQTNAYRLVHGAADGWPGLYVDRLGEFLLAQSEKFLTENQCEFVKKIPSRGIYHKTLRRDARDVPRWLTAEKAPSEIIIRENGLNFSLRLDEGYSIGIFLDQRDNRRRLITRYVGPGSEIPREANVLNAFAYTCAFSVCAAAGGAHVTSLDLSKKYLEWGRRNFALNNLNAEEHDFIYGDAFDWFHRMAKKERCFDLVILDPPTFSRSKEGGVFQAEKHYGKLARAALSVLNPGGFILASCNAATLDPDRFLNMIAEAVVGSRRQIAARQYVPQPPDFPIHRDEPAYLKTVWLKID